MNDHDEGIEDRGPIAPTEVAVTPNELTVGRARRGSQRTTIRLGKGDVLFEGDRVPVPPAVERWIVTAVTPDLVTGRRVVDGAPAVWTRVRLERLLASGGVSKLPTAVERTEAVEMARGRGGGSDRAVLVSIFGDDGRRYVRRYVPDGPGSRRVRLDRDDPGLRDAPGRLRDVVDTWSGRALARVGRDVAE